MPVKEKKNTKKVDNIDEEKLQQEEAERLTKLKQQEEKRQKRWIEDWERKIQDAERLEDCKACCAPDKFFPKPRTQSNVWIQVNHEKNTQQVQMSFMNVPIPKPKPPPLPRLKVIDDPKTNEEKSDSKPITEEAKEDKKTKKKKK